MEHATASDVLAILGSLDEDLVARIVELQPTKAELLEAKAWMAADHYMGPAGKPPPTGVVKEICDLVEAAEAQMVEEPTTPAAKT